MKTKLLLLLLLFIISLKYVYSYEIYDGWDDDYAYFDYIEDHNIIVDKDIYATLYASMVITRNYTGYHPYLPIYFRPWERLDQSPAEDLRIYFCNGRITGWYYRKDIYCDKQIEIKTIAKHTSNRSFVKEKLEFFNYSTFEFNISNYLNFSEWNFITLVIEYKLPNVVSKQGDLYFINLHYPNMRKIKDENFIHYVLLPSRDAVPLLLSEDVEKDRLAYEYEKNKWDYKWGLKFRGNKDRLLWYNDVKEVEKKQEELQDRYTKKGIKWGFVIAVLLIFIERFMFDWTPFGNYLFQQIIKLFNPDFVIGNKYNKIYHRVDCPYLNNVKKENRITFAHLQNAKNQKFVPCKICNLRDT